MKKLDKIRALLIAQQKLQEAENALRLIQNDSSDHRFLCEDATYFANKIADLLSCDHDQAGLNVFIRKVNN